MAADYLTSAQDQARAQKIAVLRDIAANGPQGGYNQAQQDVQNSQQQAVQAALAAAGRIGAPAAANQGIQDRVSAPYDRRLSDLSASAQSHQQLMDASTRANSNYMDQTAAAVGPLREIVNRRVAELRADAQQKAAEQAFQSLQHQWAMEEHQAKMAEAAKPPSLSSIVGEAGGADYLGQQLGALSEPSSAQSKYAETEHTLYGTPNDPQRAEIDALGRTIGLPSGYGSYLANQSATKAAAAAARADAVQFPDDAALAKKAGMSGPKSVQAARQSSEYVTAVEYAKTGASAGYTYNDLVDKLASVLPNNPKVAKLILAEYGSLYHN